MASTTVTPSGQGGAYSSTQAAIAGEYGDQITAADGLDVLISGDWTGETGANYSYTTAGASNALYPLRYIVDTANQAGLAYEPNKFRFWWGSGIPLFANGSHYVEFLGTQIYQDGPSPCMRWRSGAAFILSRCFVGLTDATTWAFWTHSGTGLCSVRASCIDSLSPVAKYEDSSVDKEFLNCTFVGAQVESLDLAFAVTNCIGPTFGAVSAGSDYNAATDDATAPGANSLQNTGTGIYVDYAGGDYHIDSGAVVVGAGIAIAGVTEDIDDNAYLDPPTIGAHEAGGAIGPTGISVLIGVFLTQAICPIGLNSVVQPNAQASISPIANRSLVNSFIGSPIAPIVESALVQPSVNRALVGLAQGSKVDALSTAARTGLSTGSLVGVFTNQPISALTPQAQNALIRTFTNRPISPIGENVLVSVETNEPIGPIANGVAVSVFANQPIAPIAASSIVQIRTSVPISPIADGAVVAVDINQPISTSEIQARGAVVGVFVNRPISAIAKAATVQPSASQSIAPIAAAGFVSVFANQPLSAIVTQAENALVGVFTNQPISAIAKTVSVSVETSQPLSPIAESALVESFIASPVSPLALGSLVSVELSQPTSEPTLAVRGGLVAVYCSRPICPLPRQALVNVHTGRPIAFPEEELLPVVELPISPIVVVQGKSNPLSLDYLSRQRPGSPLVAVIGPDRFPLVGQPRIGARDACAATLRAYLMNIEFQNDHGKDLKRNKWRLNDILEGWPDSKKKLEYPSASIVPAEASDHMVQPEAQEESLDFFGQDTVLWKTSEIEVDFQVDFWTNTEADRRAVDANISRIFNPSETRNGILLAGDERFFYSIVRATLIGTEKIDDSQSSFEGERRLRTIIKCEMDVVHLRSVKQLAITPQFEVSEKS